MAEFKLPDLGEGVTEAEVDRWLVKEGQEIVEDELLVEVITDKATAEIPSPFAGVVTKLHVAEGETVPVGTTLITITPTGAGVDREVEAAQEAEALLSRAEDGDVPAERVPQAGNAGRGLSERTGTSPPAGPTKSVKAMPPIRKLARELGIDISAVSGSGPHGRILREDVEAYASGTAADGRGTVEGERREPFRGVRRMIAEHMVRAHQAIPSVTHVEECDVTELQATRRKANEREPHAAKLTFLPFIVKASVAALKKHPEMNSSLDEDAREIVLHGRCDIGIAVNAPQGLVVPVVRGADERSLRNLAGEIQRLAEGARAGSLRPDELKGSTFSITSPGPFAGLMATPIINYPEAAILGVHQAQARPVVRDGQVVVREMMNVSITFDHRLVDGVTAASFCKEIVELLEHPALLMFHA
jgi:pyruvate/2-oxoglutarate dehydrogenase complex dihydrolipoamide acyltransferase (E2) component